MGALAQSAMLLIQTNNIQSKKRLLVWPVYKRYELYRCGEWNGCIARKYFTKRTLLFHGKHEWCSANDMQVGLQKFIIDEQ